MFELLFNQPLTVWRDATLVFESGWSPAALALICVLTFVLVGASLLRVPMPASRRVLVAAMQGIALSALLLMLWRPALQVEELRPGENVVAWVSDVSRSMSIADVDGQPRSKAVRDALPASGLLDTSVFAIERYATGTANEPAPKHLEPGEPLPDSREGSAIAAALDDVLGNVDDRGLAAVVLLSDGADTLGSTDAAWWQRLASSGVPVHVVGVGDTARSGDIELVDVLLPERVPRGATVNARLTIAHPLQAGAVRLRVERGDELLLAEDVTLDGVDGESIHVARFVAGETGLAELTFSLQGDAPDTHPANDLQRRVLEVDERKRRVLYVEGEPRWEFKFLRRALHDDPEIEIVSLLRTSANKFYRQGVRDADELSDGFPPTREALFAYDAVIIGSLAAAELDAARQAALRDFVGERGGALLMLGGRQGLADGGWGRSAVAAALPVALDARLGAKAFRRERAPIRLTRRGEREDWLRLGVASDADDDALDLVWSGLPDVADRQDIGRIKPGASVLLAFADGDPAWAMQRYGLGSSHVFGTSGTWRWQMGLPSDDQRHERFWQGVLTNLVSGNPERLRVTTASAVVRDDGSTRVDVLARDAAFEPLARDALEATIVSPDGARAPVELVAELARPGQFTVAVPTPVDGPWSLEVLVRDGGEAAFVPPVVATHRWLVESGSAEDFGHLQHRDFLERIADVTGGSYRSIDAVQGLAATLAERNAAATREARLPLWSMPFLFLVILSAKAFEWIARLRWKRL